MGISEIVLALRSTTTEIRIGFWKPPYCSFILAVVCEWVGRERLTRWSVGSSYKFNTLEQKGSRYVGRSFMKNESDFKSDSFVNLEVL